MTEPNAEEVVVTAAPEASGSSGGGSEVTMGSPMAVESAAGYASLSAEQKKALNDAKKKLKVTDTKKLLKRVGVSTTVDGSSLLADESRSKSSQLSNCAVVAALLGSMTVGARAIAVPSELAGYVELLQEYGLLGDTAALADQLDAMPRTRDSGARHVCATRW